MRKDVGVNDITPREMHKNHTRLSKVLMVRVYV